MKSKITQRFLQSFQLIPSIFFIFTLGFVTGCESENRGVIFTVSTASSSGLGTLDFGNVQLGKTSARKIVFMAQTVKQKAATILSVTASDPAINLYKEDVTHTGFDIPIM